MDRVPVVKPVVAAEVPLIARALSGFVLKPVFPPGCPLLTGAAAVSVPEVVPASVAVAAAPSITAPLPAGRSVELTEPVGFQAVGPDVMLPSCTSEVMPSIVVALAAGANPVDVAFAGIHGVGPTLVPPMVTAVG